MNENTLEAFVRLLRLKVDTGAEVDPHGTRRGIYYAGILVGVMRTRSIQFRLTLWYALVLAAALGLFGVLIWLSLRQRLIDDADRQLSGSASRFEQYFRREAATETGAQLRDELEEFCQALPGSDYLKLHGRVVSISSIPSGACLPGIFGLLRRGSGSGARLSLWRPELRSTPFIARSSCCRFCCSV